MPPYRHPGQIPKLDPELQRTLSHKPPPQNFKRWMYKPIRNARDVVEGLQLTGTEEIQLERLVKEVTRNAKNRLQISKDLMEGMLLAGIAQGTRQVAMRRAIELYSKETKKSGGVEIWTVEEIEKASKKGVFFKRVRTEDGKRRYYHTEDQYKKKHGTHEDGAELRKNTIQKCVMKRVKGAGANGIILKECLGDLVTKYGGKDVHGAVSDLTTVAFRKGRLYELASYPEPKKTVGRPAGKAPVVVRPRHGGAPVITRSTTGRSGRKK